MKQLITAILNSWQELKQKIDQALNFNEHASSLCKKPSQEQNTLSRMCGMTFIQRRLVLKSFIRSYFPYCLVLSMFHSRKLNKRINHIHGRALKMVCKDFKSSFQELFIENNSFNIHIRNLKKVATEIFKVKKANHLSS